MRSVSTRGESPSIGFLDAVLAGLAPDGGLYVPERWPTFSPDEIAAFAGQPYAKVAATVARFAAERPAPYILMVERATPAPPGIVPAPLPAEISNRHLEYALTWFGLAVTLLFIYAAMLWRKMRS